MPQAKSQGLSQSKPSPSSWSERSAQAAEGAGEGDQNSVRQPAPVPVDKIADYIRIQESAAENGFENEFMVNEDTRL